MAERHIVSTAHIRKLINNGLSLAAVAHGHTAGSRVETIPEIFESPGGETDPLVDQVLGKAAADLRHAAEELEAERLSCYGWKQQ